MSTPSHPIGKTPLYNAFVQRGGRMVPFAGFEMAVQFSGILQEHHAVRTQVGLFDVSHMGKIRLVGSGALALAQKLFAKDLSKLGDYDACYTVMCLPSGGIIDDVIVYREPMNQIFVIINASRAAVDLAHIKQVMASSPEVGDVGLEDLSETHALIALQGPSSDAVLSRILRHTPDKRFTFTDTQTSSGLPVRVARTGYTGERGVEILVDALYAENLLTLIEEHGGAAGLTLCGLGARDSLRLEKKLPLYGNDLDETTSPLEAGIGFAVSLDKSTPFIGQSALLQQRSTGLTRKWVGFRMEGKKIPRHGYAVHVDGKLVSQVTSGVMSPCLNIGIGCAYIPTEWAAIGQSLQIDIRGSLETATIVQTPFVKTHS